MKKSLISLLYCLTASVSAQSPSPAAAPHPVTTSTSNAHTTVRAGDDFYEFVNGEWEQKTEIPADRGSWGVFSMQMRDTELQLQKIMQQLLQPESKLAVTAESNKVRDFYLAYMDEARIETLGLSPLQPQLERIAAIKTRRQLAQILGASIRADVDPLNLSRYSTENIFGLWVAQGFHDPQHNHAYLLQGGLGLPDQVYYQAKPKMQALQQQYRQHIATLLQLAGLKDSAARAEKIFQLELALAASHTTRQESDEVTKADNSWKLSEFSRRAPGMDWRAFFASAQLNRQQSITVWHPKAVIRTAQLVQSHDLHVWRDYLTFHTLNHAASLLPKAFAEQHYAFYGVALAGTPSQAPRERRAIAAVDEALGDALGQLYVQQYFPAENKARITTMVSNVIAAFSRRIDKLDWMAASTKAQAQEKLKTLYVGIGYPDRWKSYQGLAISPQEALGNQLRAEQFATQQALAKLGKTVDRSEWVMSSQTVNAANLPLQNALIFPAAILQAPMFDATADEAQNYGAIGAVIGHEISHSFDDSGAQFDAQGRLRNWWTAQDLSHFKEMGQALATQYNAYQALPDLAVNGQQTLNENISDLAGLSAALDAYHATLGKAASLQHDRLFIAGYALAWRNKSREASLRRQLLTGGHSPARYRTATVRNVDEWYRAYDVQAGQGLYLAPEKRVKVW
ncbi:MAG: M13 family metallopeptidase [Burkholderiales bacterium]|nr:M13 family metallopeptidase [Burkholderiales bacterium]